MDGVDLDDYQIDALESEGYRFETYTIADEDQPQIDNENRTLESSERSIEHIDFRGGHGGIAPQLKPAHIPPTGMAPGGPSKNTGAKGVQADYKEAKFNVEKIRLQTSIREARAVHMMAHGDNTRVLKEIQNEEGEQIREKMSKKFDEQEKQSYNKKYNNGFDESEDESSDLSDDDEIFNSYKLQQFQLIKNSIPTFGGYERVDKYNMAKVNNTTHELCYVITHIYENHIPACVKVNLIFEHLCTIFTHVHFQRIRASDAGQSQKGIPSLLIYKAGKMVDGITRLDIKLGGKITDEAVVKFLSERGILKSSTMALEERLVSKLKADHRNQNEDLDM